MTNIKKVILKSQLVLGTIGDSSTIKDTIGVIISYASSRNIKIKASPVIIKHEGFQTARNSSEDVEACVPISQEAETDPEGKELGLACYQLPGGNFVKIIQEQAEEEPDKQQILEWCAKNNCSLRGGLREYLISYPQEFPKELCFIIEERKEDKILVKEIK